MIADAEQTNEGAASASPRFGESEDVPASGTELAPRVDESAREPASLPLKLKVRHPMELLLRSSPNALLPKVGEIVDGTVIEKRGARLFVDLGARGTGIVYGREYYAAQDMIEGMSAGEVVSAKVVDPDNPEGYVELSLKDAGEERRWIELAELKREGQPLELPALDANRGGLILELKGVRGFLPASQLSAKNYPRVEGGDKEKVFQELQKFVGQTLTVKILDLDQAEQKLIFTEKGVDEAAIRQALAKYKIGEVVEGEITGVVDFGAFMKFDEALGLEGLIHISEIDWTLIEDPRQVLKPGERVRAKIIDIAGEKVSLSLKALKEDPWAKVSEKYRKGDTVTGRVTKFNPFGVFVALDKEIQGLVHISEFGSEMKMRSELELGKEYDFKILLIDPKEHRMSLGMVRSEKVAAPEPQSVPKP